MKEARMAIFGKMSSIKKEERKSVSHRIEPTTVDAALFIATHVQTTLGSRVILRFVGGRRVRLDGEGYANKVR